MADDVGEHQLDAQLGLQATRVDERPGLATMRCPTLIVAAAARCAVQPRAARGDGAAGPGLASWWCWTLRAPVAAGATRPAISVHLRQLLARSPTVAMLAPDVELSRVRVAVDSSAREGRTLGQRGQLGVDDVGVDGAEAGEGGEPAVGAGHAPAPPDQVDEAAQPVRHDPRDAR